LQTAGKRAERADAQRNRQKVLETADRLFGERGTAVSLGEIAVEAGVGAGTVYRHFPTKDALLATVLDQRLAQLEDHGAAMLARDDAGPAFFAYLDFLVDKALANRAICEALAGRGDWQEPSKLEGRCVIDSPLSDLLRRAQQAGTVRADLAPGDVRALLAGCVGMSGPADRARRLATIVWDGLRVSRNEASRDETRIQPTGRDESSVTEPRCPVCHGRIAPSATGRPPTYCSAACRQKAFRDRRRTA
jgi:AcrR family transcriptional regulator